MEIYRETNENKCTDSNLDALAGSSEKIKRTVQLVRSRIFSKLIVASIFSNLMFGKRHNTHTYRHILVLDFDLYKYTFDWLLKITNGLYISARTSKLSFSIRKKKSGDARGRREKHARYDTSKVPYLDISKLSIRYPPLLIVYTPRIVET